MSGSEPLETMWRHALYRAVVDTAVDAIIVLDETGLIQSANVAAERMFGYPASEIVGKTIDILMPVDEIAWHRDNLAHDLATGDRKGVGRSVMGRHKSGSQFPADLSVAEWTADDGRRFFTGILRDMTESRAAAAALRENQEWLATVSDTALVGLVVIDRDHCIRFANRAFAVLYRLASHDLAGFPVADILPEIYEREIRARLDATFAGRRDSYESTLSYTEGPADHRFLTATYEPSRSALGDQVAVVVITDVTDLKGKEAELRANRDLLQSVLDGTLDAIFAKDTVGRYVALNASAGRLFGRSRRDVLGHTDLEFRENDFATGIRQEDEEVMRTGTPFIAERRLNVGGKERHFVVTKRPWSRPDGRPRGIVGIAQDVSDQRQAAAERREVAKRLLRAQEEERLRIARDLHDQVGQDLTALSLGLKALDGHVQEGHVDQLAWLRDLTGQISRNLHRTALQLRSTTLDDLGLRAAITSHIAEHCERFNLTVDVHLDELDSVPLEPDVEIALFRGVQEAVTNVLKHAQATSVSVVARYTPPTLRLIVEDNGRGIVPVPNGGPRVGGLGLVGLRERLGLIGGTLTIESTPGCGTSVFMTLSVAT